MGSREKLSLPRPKNHVSLTAIFLTLILVTLSFHITTIFLYDDIHIYRPISSFISTDDDDRPSSYEARETLSETNTTPEIFSTPETSSPPLYTIHVIGERHSGTNWIEDEMHKCFGHAVRVVPTLFRFKHWWQSPSVAAPPANNPPQQYGIVIALFRNPYDWMEAMRTEPHHAIEHWDIVPNKPLKWKEFMTKPWNMNRLKFQDWMKGDLTILKDLVGNQTNMNIVPIKRGKKKRQILQEFDNFDIPNNTILRNYLFNHSCYEDFYWFDIVPCSRGDRDITKLIVPFAEALYELKRDGSGVPFDNIIQLRGEKIRHFYKEVASFPNIQHFLPYRYEDLVTQGTQNLIDKIQLALPGNIQTQCTPSPPKKYLHKLLPRGMHEYLNQNLNWTVENMVGYKLLSNQELWEEKQDYNKWNIQNYILSMDKKVKEKMNQIPSSIPRDRSRYGIHILGERHSGTTFLHRHLESCFGNDVKIYSNLTRHKYWFQLDDITQDFGMVVATFRNVYDWLQAMMDKPIHAPLHYDIDNQKSFPFQSFLTREWGLDRQRFKKLVKDDLRTMEFYENADLNETKGMAIHMESCYENFTFYDIIPCSLQDRNRTKSLVLWSQTDNVTDSDDGDFGAVYEMKIDHNRKRLEPYKTIFELRRDKMIHFYLEVSRFVSISKFIAMRYEDLIEKGTVSLIKDIERTMGVQSICTPEKLSSNRNIYMRQKAFISMVNEAVDWSAEALMGYEKI